MKVQAISFFTMIAFACMPFASNADISFPFQDNQAIAFDQEDFNEDNEEEISFELNNANLRNPIVDVTDDFEEEPEPSQPQGKVVGKGAMDGASAAKRKMWGNIALAAAAVAVATTALILVSKNNGHHHK